MRHNRDYRPGTRAARFLEIRDAILPHIPKMRRVRFGKEMTLGPFVVLYSPPGAWGPLRGFNLQIWPDGKLDHGQLTVGHKVANVDWSQWDEVDILSYRSGTWEAMLLAMLSGPDNLIYLPRR